MAVTYLDSSTGQANTSDPYSITLPSTVQDGGFVFVAVTIRNATIVAAPDSSWIQLGDDAGDWTYLWGKFTDGTEGGASTSWDLNLSNDSAAYVCMSFGDVGAVAAYNAGAGLLTVPTMSLIQGQQWKDADMTNGLYAAVTGAGANTADITGYPTGSTNQTKARRTTGTYAVTAACTKSSDMASLTFTESGSGTNNSTYNLWLYPNAGGGGDGFGFIF